MNNFLESLILSAVVCGGAFFVLRIWALDRATCKLIACKAEVDVLLGAAGPLVEIYGYEDAPYVAEFSVVRDADAGLSSVRMLRRLRAIKAATGERRAALTAALVAECKAVEDERVARSNRKKTL